MSAIVAFRRKDGVLTLEHFAKSFDLYTTDLLFTLAIVLLSTLLIGLVAIAIAGYLTLGENPRTVSILRWLYRWPLFIPFVVAGQVMRTFLAKNGMLNHVLIGSGLIQPLSAQSLLDWRGIVIAFVWQQAHFVTLPLAGATATPESQHIEARRNLRPRRLREIIHIVLSHVRATLQVGLVLSLLPAARQSARIARHEHLDRAADRGALARGGDTVGLRAGAAQAAMEGRNSAAVSPAAGRAESSCLCEHRAGVLPDRAQWHDIRCRAGPRVARARPRGLDRIGGVRVGRCLARRSVTQS